MIFIVKLEFTNVNTVKNTLCSCTVDCDLCLCVCVNDLLSDHKICTKFYYLQELRFSCSIYLSKKCSIFFIILLHIFVRNIFSENSLFFVKTNRTSFVKYSR